MSADRWRSYIGGGWVSSDRRHDVIDPSTERLIATVPDCGGREVRQAVEAAVGALPEWRETTPQERSTLLYELADRMGRAQDALVDAESANAGKPLAAARLEVEHAIDAVRFFAGVARGAGASGSPVGEYAPDLTMMLRREPIGVAGLIAPWNYPVNMAVWKLAPALAAGNTCVLKPSELTPLTALMLAELADGLLPPGVCNVVTGGDEAGVALVEDPRVGVISLTGATDTGRSVARTAAQTLKRLHLELGGKAPVIVFEDADIGAMASRLRGGAFWNAGQDCTAATRVIAAAPVYDAVVEALVDMISTVTIGPPDESNDPYMGPVISAAHRQRVLGFISGATAGTVVTGGSVGIDRGYFVKPTLIAGVGQDEPIVQQEVFGPVLTVQRFTTPAEALAMANDTEFGLAASVWTRDIGLGMDMTRLLDFGTVWVNDHGTFISEMPHGGFKQSGFGKDLSALAIDEFSRVKNVMVNIDRHAIDRSIR